MAGTITDFVLYEAQFNSAFSEVAMQFADMFNAASRGALTLTNEFHRGDFWQESRFLDGVTVQDRDPTDVSAATADVLTQDEQIGVKVNKMILAEHTEDAFRKIALSPENFSRVVGLQSSERVQVDRVNRILIALAGAIEAGNAAGGFGVGTTIYDTGGAPVPIDYTGLNATFRLFGDRASSLGLIVMHSAQWFDLIGATIGASTGFNVLDMTLVAATPATFGRPVLVTDSSSLINVGGGPLGVDLYRTMLLNTAQAGETTQSETASPLLERVGGLGNIVMRTQIEWSDTIKCRAYKYTGTLRPDDAALGTAGNWGIIKSASDEIDIRSSAGVILESTLAP